MHVLALLLLLGLSVVIKLGIWQQPPQIFNDSPGYLVPAVSLLGGHGYGIQQNGFRTPTYPLFLAIVLAPLNRTSFSACTDAHSPPCLGRALQTASGAFALRAIVVAQILLGLVTTLILYALGWKLSGHFFVATLFGAGFALNLGTAYWEISILTETLTTFLLALSVLLTLHAGAGDARVRVALGLTLGALALCHSLFLIYWLLPTAFLFSRRLVPNWRAAWRNAGARVAPVLLIPLALVCAWSAFNYFVNGFFTPSTLTGYVLVQMVAPALEKAPPEYQDLAQIYIRYRDATIKETGSHSGAVFGAIPDMAHAANLNWSQLSQALTHLTFDLIIADPGSYLNVARLGWDRFWNYTFYNYEPVPPGPAQWLLWFTDPNLQRVLSILFWLSLPLWLILRTHRPLSRADALPFASIGFVMATVWFAGIMIALTNFQDNARHHTYVLPLQYGTIIWMAWASWRIIVAARASTASTKLPVERREDQAPGNYQAREESAGQLPPAKAGGL